MRLQLVRPLHQPLLVECLHPHLLSQPILLLLPALLLVALLVVMSRSEAATNR